MAVRAGLWSAGLAIFVMPLVMVCALALGGNQFPFLLQQGLTTAVWNSLFTAGVSAVLAVVVGTASALLLERTDVWGKPVLRVLLLSPMLVPPFVGAISWLQLFGRNQGLNRVFSRPIWDIYGADGIIFLMTLHSFPIVYVILTAALRSLPGDLERAARVSGATGFVTMRTITLPLLYPAMLSALTLTLVSHFADFGIPSILGSPVRFETLATMIYRMMESGTVPNPLQVVSTIGSVLLVMAVAVVILDYLASTKDSSTSRGSAAEIVKLGIARPWVSLVCWAIALFVTLGPIVGLATRAFLPAPGIALRIENLTLGNFLKAFGNPRVIQGFQNSLFLALCAGVICGLFGLAIAVWVSRTRSWWNTPLSLIVLLPTALPGLIISVGWLIFGRYTGLYNTRWVILLAYVCAFTALVVQAARGPLSSMGPELEDAARISGAGALRAILDTSTRLAVFPALSGAVLVFLTAVRELTISVLLVAPGMTTIGVQLFNLQQAGNYNQACALALIFTLLGVAGLSLVLRDGSKAQRGAVRATDF